MTHDSIGLGEDGPTTSRLNICSALRAIPNMRVFRPCDAVEVAECWRLALNRSDGPTVLALTRQNLPQLRTTAGAEIRAAKAAMELVAAQGEAKVSFFASGSGGRDRGSGAEATFRARHCVARGFGAGAELLLAQPDERKRTIIGQRPDQGRNRGRRALGLGCRDRQRMVNLSACTPLARARRPRISTSTSALPPRPPLTLP